MRYLCFWKKKKTRKTKKTKTKKKKTKKKKKEEEEEEEEGGRARRRRVRKVERERERKMPRGKDSCRGSGAKAETKDTGSRSSSRRRRHRVGSSRRRRRPTKRGAAEVVVRRRRSIGRVRVGCRIGRIRRAIGKLVQNRRVERREQQRARSEEKRSNSLSKSQSSNPEEDDDDDDPIKSGDLAHLGFPFDGEFGKNELKESLRVAFRERTDTGKGQGKRKGEPMKAKKTKKKTKTTERRDPGGDVASIDDAWAKITNGNNTIRNDDDDAGKTVRGNAKSNNTKNGNTFGDATMGGAMTERKSSSSNIDPSRTITSSLFMAQKSLQDLVKVLGLTNAANAPSVEQMAAHDASPMTSYNIAEIAKMMSTFVGSGNGSNGNNDAVDGHTKRANNQKETDEDKGNKNVTKKKKRIVSKTNVPRVEIDNNQIVELTKEDINLIVTPGGIKSALPPRKKGRRAHNFTDAETEEEKNRRREERVYKNRQSAARSRARKLKTIGELQEEISRLTCENDALRELCKSSGVTEATITTKLGETEAQRQKEKKEVEERDDAKKVTKSPGSVSGKK